MVMGWWILPRTACYCPPAAPRLGKGATMAPAFKVLAVDGGGIRGIIPALDIGQRKPMFFKSEKAKLSPADDFAMRDVVRATTAAPTFFQPTKVQPADSSSSYGLVDGGIDAGNPAMCAYAEAIKMGRAG